MAYKVGGRMVALNGMSWEVSLGVGEYALVLLYRCVGGLRLSVKATTKTRTYNFMRVVSGIDDVSAALRDFASTVSADDTHTLRIWLDGLAGSLSRPVRSLKEYTGG